MTTKFLNKMYKRGTVVRVTGDGTSVIPKNIPKSVVGQRGEILSVHATLSRKAHVLCYNVKVSNRVNPVAIYHDAIKAI